jgi:hypothetical protein
MFEGRDQQLGHIMTKRVMSAFDFDGMGVDSCFTGKIMTLASLVIVQLCLNATLSRSNLEPLACCRYVRSPKDCQTCPVGAELGNQEQNKGFTGVGLARIPNHS